jgi:hypothetical protein
MNTLFQYTWAFVKKFRTIPFTMIDYATDPTKYAEQWGRNTMAQLLLAEHFGGSKIIMLGDSNVEFGNSPDQMKTWNQVTANAGKAGSRFDQLLDMLCSPSGRLVLRYIKDHSLAVFVNCGGNNVLQNSMGVLDDSEKVFSSLLLQASHTVIAQDLPDINTQILAPYYKETPAQMITDIQTANGVIAKYFPQVVKFGEFLMSLDAQDPTHLPGLSLSVTHILGDGLVHYSPEFNKRYRYPYLSKLFAGVK